MVPPALLLLLLPPLLLGGSAALPSPPRARRHSDGMFTSELSRLRESARLQRLLQGLVGKRSEHDPENTTTWTTSAEGRLCLLRPAGHAHPAGLDALECPPGSGRVSLAASWMETWGHGFRARHPCC